MDIYIKREFNSSIYLIDIESMTHISLPLFIIINDRPRSEFCGGTRPIVSEGTTNKSGVLVISQTAINVT